jgi:hypothetical protein
VLFNFHSVLSRFFRLYKYKFTAGPYCAVNDVHIVNIHCVSKENYSNPIHNYYEDAHISTHVHCEVKNTLKTQVKPVNERRHSSDCNQYFVYFIGKKIKMTNISNCLIIIRGSNNFF